VRAGPGPAPVTGMPRGAAVGMSGGGWLTAGAALGEVHG
jgi:hypothetical protein